MIPEGPGLIELREANRYLYVSRNEAIRSAIDQLKSGQAFDLVANGFWTPRPEQIIVQYVAGERIEKVGLGLWERL